MPLILDADGPIAGTLAMPATWASLFAAVPGLIGAWDARDLSLGVLASWPAAHGTGLLRQTTTANQPTVVDAGGQNVAQFGLTKRLDLATVLTSGNPLTIAMRVNLLDNTIDNQALFGGNATWRSRFRNNTGGTVSLETSGGNITRPLTAGGWHDVVVVQGASANSLDLDNGTAIAGTSAGATITALAIGALAANDTTTNWRGYMSRIAIANAALSGDALATFRAWLNS